MFNFWYFFCLPVAPRDVQCSCTEGQEFTRVLWKKIPPFVFLEHTAQLFHTMSPYIDIRGSKLKPPSHPQQGCAKAALPCFYTFLSLLEWKSLTYAVVWTFVKTLILHDRWGWILMNPLKSLWSQSEKSWLRRQRRTPGEWNLEMTTPGKQNIFSGMAVSSIF